METYAVIMAGGVGSRFWPRSRERRPKQLLNILSEKTLIQNTRDRLDGLIPDKNVLVITNKLQAEQIQKQLPGIPAENIIAEPFGRNTAACIGLAAKIVEKRSPGAVMVVVPADHIIRDVPGFISILGKGIDFAREEKALVTIGIEPTRPETGYGYIQIEQNPFTDHIYKVSTFAEKPNFATAVRFVQSGDFFWNSGMFIWRSDVILEELALYLPETAKHLNELDSSVDNENFYSVLEEVYGKLKSISIDYGVMEKSTRVYLLKGSFSWSDVGSWEEIYNLEKKDDNGNVLEGKVFAEMVNDSYIYSPDIFTAVVGVDNVVVINTGDALLICRKDLSQEVKKVVEHLKLNNNSDIL